MSATPQPPAANAADDVRIAYGNLWSRAEAERISAQAWADVHAREAAEMPIDTPQRAIREKLAADLARQAAEWVAMMRLIERVAASAVINDELRRIAEAERLDGDHVEA